MNDKHQGPHCAGSCEGAAYQIEIRRLKAENEALRKALREVMDRDMRNTCQHEDTHRGGAIWEICSSCGAMWADDEGGKPEWQDPPEWTKAYKALAAHDKEGK